jgi:tetratricopeptide (TPR) repeat protein
MSAPGPQRRGALGGGRRCAGCGTVLAADNTARLCGRCRREHHDLLHTPPRLGNEFYETGEFRAAFESRLIGKVFKAYRNHPRWLHLLGKALSQEAFGRWVGLSQGQVSKLESGKLEEHNFEVLQYYAVTLYLPQHMLWFDLPGQSRLRPSQSSRATGNLIVPGALDPEGASFVRVQELVAVSGPYMALNASGQPGDGSIKLDRTDLAGGEFISIPVQMSNGVIVYVITRRIFLETLATVVSTITLSSDTMSLPNRRPALDYTTAATAILGDGMQTSVPSAPPTSWATAIYDAVLNPVGAARRVEGHAEERAMDPRLVRPAVNRAMHVSLSSDYTALEQLLPDLIGLAEIAAMRAGGDDRAAQLALSDVYAVVGWTLIKADNPAGAFIAAQRALQAAEHADDALRVAAATRCLAEVHMRAANFEAATRIAFLAAVHLESAPPADRLAAISIRGAALLSAAAASARRGDRREAQAALKAAAACAAELRQDRADLATVFGPTNVAIHRVAIAIELGDAHEAARHIPTVQLDHMSATLTERQARFLIDVARSYAKMKDDAAAIDALIRAEAIAPDELRGHRLTRELIPQLLTRERRSSDLRALAGRCHLLA